MQALKRIWQDVRRGENIGEYVTIIAAISLAILDLLGIVPPDWIAPLTLAVLGLLAAGMLGNRHKIEHGLQQLAEPPSELFQEQSDTRLETDLAQAATVWLVGVTLSRTIKTNYSLFERKLARGDAIRVLLVDPKGAGVEMAAGREYGGRFDANRLRGLIQGSLDDLGRLKQQSPTKLQVRVIDNPLTFGGIATNPDDASFHSRNAVSNSPPS